MLLSSNLFISWSDQKYCFPEGIKTPVKDYFLPLLDHRKQEQSFTLNRLYHPVFHRASGCLFRNSLYRHVCSLPTALIPSIPHGDGESRCTQVLFCDSPFLFPCPKAHFPYKSHLVSVILHEINLTHIYSILCTHAHIPTKQRHDNFAPPQKKTLRK